jgi:hypothetical protein
MNRRLRTSIAISAWASLGGLAPAIAKAAETRSQSFVSTGHEQVFVVPPGVSSLRATLIGGSGASTGTAAGGLGANVLGTLAVTPGQQLFVEVGGDGTNFEPGYNGGGQEIGPSGSGGGASDVRTCSEETCPPTASLDSRLLVAGGGGGGGEIGLAGLDDEGGGGGSAGEHGERGSPDQSAAGGIGGGAGLLEAGGAAGGNSSGAPATSGELGRGGTGGEGGFSHGGGGGGGGGIYGGGGGGGGLYEVEGMNAYNAGGAGGGGGSSGVPVGAPGAALLASGLTAEQPSVTFAWTSPPPAALTGGPAALTSTSATLTGTVNPDLSVVGDCHFTISPAPPAGASVPCLQQVGSGGAPVAVTAPVSGLSPATTYTVALVATSAQGSSSGAPMTFPTPGSGAGADTTLRVTDLTLSPAHFRRGTHAATLATHARAGARRASASGGSGARAGSSARKDMPIGTTISFTLSETATVTLTFQHAQPGIASAGHCLAPSPKRRHGKRCTRYTAVHGSVSIAAPAGADRIGFDGLLAGGAKLAPGGYRLVLSASNTSGTASAAQRPSFTLVG